jgi:hypothetical protein
MWLWILSIWALSATADCPPDDSTFRGPSEVERINRRYDDFFQYQHRREEHEAHLQKGVPEVKAEQEARSKVIERSRLEYKRTPKDYAKEEAMRIDWEKNQRERDKKMEQARVCEVQQRRAAAELLKKGRQIPEMKEFDLEDY